MTIIQPTKPPDITPDKWTSEIWHYILKFLQPLDASFLFYSAINGAESLDANRKQEALNAANVDKIMQMQRNQFLAQASYLNFDPETQSPFKIKTPGGQQAQETMELANEAGVKIETINFIKLPPGFYAEMGVFDRVPEGFYETVFHTEVNPSKRSSRAWESRTNSTQGHCSWHSLRRPRSSSALATRPDAPQATQTSIAFFLFYYYSKLMENRVSLFSFHRFHQN